MDFIISGLICFALGLILSKIEDKANQILKRMNEFEKETMSYHRGFESSFTVLEKEIRTIKELVGEEK